MRGKNRSRALALASAIAAVSCAGARPKVESFTIQPVTLVFKHRPAGAAKHSVRPSPFFAQAHDDQGYDYEWDDDVLEPGSRLPDTCGSLDYDCEVSGSLKLHKRLFAACLEHAGKAPDATVA